MFAQRFLTPPRGSVLALSLLVACSDPRAPAPVATPGPASPAPLAPVAPVARTGQLRVQVTLGEGVTVTRRAAGRLAIAWLTPAEWPDDHQIGNFELRTTLDLLSRFCVAGDVDLEPPRAHGTCTFDLPPGRYVPVAVLDARGEFMEMFLSRGGDGNLTGFAAAPVEVRAGATVQADVALTDVWRAPPPASDSCQGPRTELVRVDAPDVAGRIGNPTARRLCVHVPPSYAGAPARRYPTIWVLPGLASGDASPLVRSVAALRDELAATLHREAIVIGVDTRTAFGSTYLVDSPVTGAWDTFLAHAAVAAVDARFRTIADGRARALLGHSTGGFNAVSFGLRHPDVFSVIAASAPDGLDLATWLLDPTRHEMRPLWLGMFRIEDAMGGFGQMRSYAADWSPDTRAPRGVRWPVDLATGALRPEVWRQWLAHSPAGLLADPAVAAAARAHLAGRVYLTVGRDDDGHLFEPTERFSAELRAAGVPHAFVPVDEGHAPSGDRRRALVDFCLRTLAPD